MPGVCYYCGVKSEIAGLNDAIPGFGDAALQYLASARTNDAELTQALISDINTAYDDGAPVHIPKRQTRGE